MRVCAQFIKGVEEGGEIFDAILNHDKDELIDAIGDRLVVATIECLNAGLDPHQITSSVCAIPILLQPFDSFERSCYNLVTL